MSEELLEAKFVAPEGHVVIKREVEKFGEETINIISDLLLEFSVVVIRNQNITDDEHIKFSENFGTLELTKVGTDGSGSKLIILRNFDENGNIVSPTDRQRLNNLANQEWHSDSSFKKIPSKMSILSAKMIPSLGGNTEFLSMRASYNALPQELKLKIDDKICWHDYSHGRSKIDPNLSCFGSLQFLGKSPHFERKPGRLIHSLVGEYFKFLFSA